MFRKLFEKIIGTTSLKNEGVFDTDVYAEFAKKHGEVKANLSSQEREKINKILQIPDARPGDFDGTLEAWLLRISIWGKIKITHKDPDSKVKEVMSNYQFLNYIDDKSRNKAYGLWNIRADKINRIVFHRTYWGISGKDVTEEIIVDIKLRPDLQKVLTKARWELGLFGQFS